MNQVALLQSLRDILGPTQVLTENTAIAPYLTDWRKRYTGRAIAVVQPIDTSQVAAIVAICARTRTPLVPQGGNTGLVGGATPDSSGNAIVLSCRRMQKIRALDPVGNTITAEAGVVLTTLQEAARNVDRLFPLSLAAEGSCTLGGNLSTNAGGTAVLRYGNARELCLALEVVTPQAEIVGSKGGTLYGLRKDNTGYDLRDLFIGAEGTLGVITAATMKLFPAPRAQVTALCGIKSPTHALALFALAQVRCASTLTAFELISDLALVLVERHYPQCRYPFGAHHPYAVLLEVSDHEDDAHARALLAEVIEAALGKEIIDDAIVAQNLAQSRMLWALRENISEAQAAEGPNIKHDISLPIATIPEFIASTDAAVQKTFPGTQIVNFGHLGDGNLHYNIARTGALTDTELAALRTPINRLVHDAVCERGGSISAEHGLGQLKREEIRRYKSESEFRLMRALKDAFDPLGIMNPGKVL